MTILNETCTLSNGVEIPKLGLGTWFIDDAEAAEVVREDVEIGYRNIDTAQAYDNERGAILENPDVQAMAEKYGVSIPQPCIRYTLQLGTVSLPKTANPEHMRFNAEVDFEISEADMAALRDLRVKDYGEHSVFPVYSGK
jgi:diketogulonate reductase-like aldo/keto reductase